MKPSHGSAHLVVPAEAVSLPRVALASEVAIPDPPVVVVVVVVAAVAAAAVKSTSPTFVTFPFLPLQGRRVDVRDIDHHSQLPYTVGWQDLKDLFRQAGESNFPQTTLIKAGIGG